MSKYSPVLLVLCVSLALGACSSDGTTELARYPVDGLDGLVTRSGIVFDTGVTSDGNGSIRISARQSTTIRLYETGDVDVENARLIYRAKLRAENIRGRAYLEMYCHFDGKGDFFSRDLETPVAGTTAWVTEETFFFLQPGQNPDSVKLNIVIEGEGTVWIDDIRLVKGPLK